MIVIDATPELMEQFYGEQPSFTSRSVVVMNDDHPVAIAGRMKRENHMVYFSEIRDELRESPEFKRVIIKAYRKLSKWMPRCHVYAVADPRIKGSETLLEHLGFEQVDDILWRV